MSRHAEILKALSGIVGEDKVTDSELVLLTYSYDIGGLTTPSDLGGEPEFVVMPDTVEEIQAVLRYANKNKLAVTPFVSGANMGGLAVPLEGGIILDLHKMNKIIEINEDLNYVIVEPGVTFGMLERELRDKGLWIPVPMAPPAAASVVGNVLLAGIGHVSGKYGNQAELLNGVEAVLPTGELTRAGTCAISPYWCGRFPIPDLTSLFVGWMGTTGIVTKMSVAVYQRPAYQDVVTVGFDDYDEAVFDFMIPWQRLEICHDVTGITWSFGAIQKMHHPLPPKPKDEPLLYVYTQLGGVSEKDIQHKKDILDDFITSQKKKGKLGTIREVEMLPELKNARIDVPNPYGGLFGNYKRGGLFWVGSFTPASRWPETLRRADEIMISYNMPPATRVSMFRGSHYGMLRSIAGYDSGNPEELKRMRAMGVELVNAILDNGGLIYKAPTWAVDEMIKRADPGYLNTIKLIKGTLDPNRILNPGRWGL
ncbi:MAG: FAD-binding oxidoreductase [Bacillota bacterium]